MLCPECSSETSPGARVCPRCGAPAGEENRSPPAGGRGADVWGPVVLTLAIGFFVWTSVMQVTGRHGPALILGVLAALAVLRLALGGRQGPPHGDRRDAQHGGAA